MPFAKKLHRVFVKYFGDIAATWPVCDQIGTIAGDRHVTQSKT